MAMARLNICMETTVDRIKLLDQLRKNLETHSQTVKEAVEGYLAHASQAIEARLYQLRTMTARSKGLI